MGSNINLARRRQAFMLVDRHPTVDFCSAKPLPAGSAHLRAILYQPLAASGGRMFQLFPADWQLPDASIGRKQKYRYFPASCGVAFRAASTVVTQLSKAGGKRPSALSVASVSRAAIRLTCGSMPAMASL